LNLISGLIIYEFKINKLNGLSMFYQRKKFHTATKPSRPVLTIYLSSGENLTEVMELE